MNIDRDSFSPDRVYDVLIVGAGPVGLAIALALFNSDLAPRKVDMRMNR